MIAGIILGSGAAILPLVPREPLPLSGLIAVLLLGATLLTWAFLRPPIAWKFDNFLGMVGGGGDLRIISFQAAGSNRSRVGFRSVQGHLVSNIDNSLSDELHFVVGGVAVMPAATTGVPPGATFQVMIPLCDATKGYDAYLSEYEFLRKWSSFRFIAELDSQRYERSFSQREVSKTIARFRRIANPSPIPHVQVVGSLVDESAAVASPQNQPTAVVPPTTNAEVERLRGTLASLTALPDRVIGLLVAGQPLSMRELRARLHIGDEDGDQMRGLQACLGALADRGIVEHHFGSVDSYTLASDWRQQHR